MTFDMRPPKVPSSHVKNIGFDEETGTLAVEFQRGGVYHYHGVDADMAQAFHKSASAGSFLHDNIRGKFKHRRA